MLLVGTLVLAIGVAVFLYLLLRRKRKAPAAQAATPTAEQTPNQDDAAKPLALAYPVSASSVRASFQEALRFLQTHVPVRDYRYRLPWYLVAGEPGAGKTDLLTSVSLNLPQKKLSNDNGQRTGLNWFFFDRAVMLEVEGDTDAVESEKQWRRILRELVRVRPEQPIEGLILAIPCTDLLPRNALDRGMDARVSELALRWQADQSTSLAEGGNRPTPAQLRDWLKNAQTDRVLEALDAQAQASADNELQHQVAMLSARHSRLELSLLKGVISADNARLEANQINDALLNLIAQLPQS